MGSVMSANSRIRPTSRMRRRGDRGIILITTLLLLTLLAGFAIAAQNRALSQARVLNEIQLVETAQIDVQSARTVALPLIGGLLLGGAEVTDFYMIFEGQRFDVELTPAARRDWYRVEITADTDASGGDAGQN